MTPRKRYVRLSDEEVSLMMAALNFYARKKREQATTIVAPEKKGDGRDWDAAKALMAEHDAAMRMFDRLDREGK